MTTDEFITAEQRLPNGKKVLIIMKRKNLPKNATRIGKTKAGIPLFRLKGIAKC